MHSDDRETIDAILAGDTERFGELVDRYQRRLLGLLWHACNDRELAEDITQETFARAYKKLALFSGDSQFYAWLARMALNLLASDRRRKRIENQINREGFELAMDTEGDFTRPEHSAERDETQRCVRQAIGKLAEERRAVLLLRDFDELDYDAIAEILQIPIGTVRSRLHRARLELRSILQTKANQLGLSGT